MFSIATNIYNSASQSEYFAMELKVFCKDKSSIKPTSY